jgi:hypothetical protein
MQHLYHFYWFIIFLKVGKYYMYIMSIYKLFYGKKIFKISFLFKCMK